jgi:NADP-dependent 3-hydroxy acid dehydrogenase YdfG
MNLTSTVAIVTGASSGIGEATATGSPATGYAGIRRDLRLDTAIGPPVRSAVAE